MKERATWTVVIVLVVFAFGSMSGVFIFAQRLTGDYARLQELTFGSLLWDVEEAERAVLLLQQTINGFHQSDPGAEQPAFVSSSLLSQQLAATISYLREMKEHSAGDEFAAHYGQYATFGVPLLKLGDWQRNLDADGRLTEGTLQDMERTLSSLAGSLNGLSWSGRVCCLPRSRRR